MDKRWRAWIDTGGTFTDCLAMDPEGEVHRLKVLSNSSLRIGNQQRPNLFSLHIPDRVPLYSRIVEVPGRLSASGERLADWMDEELEGQIQALVAEGCDAAAITFMHSYRYPGDEERLAELLSQKGFRFVSVSSDLSPFIGFLPRAETTVLDAFLSPVMNHYLERVSGPLTKKGKLYVMTSAGGLVGREKFCAKDSLLSGPAAGVVGAVSAGKQGGFSKLILFDMGGTSTDVSRFDGDYEYAFEHTVGAARLLAPALKIETVAAGGGSICHFDGLRLRVGPESAGASPGPACYGAGGPLTLTDVHLLLG